MIPKKREKEIKKRSSQIQVPDDITDKWQKICDIMAEIIGVPSGLIMRVVDSDIEVFVSSKTENNPYHSGDKESLFGSGLYCETVIKTKDKLLVPNALIDEKWKNNPDIKLNMVSYLGFPLLFPDGEPFGTICVLDNKENAYTTLHRKLIESFREIIHKNLELLYMNHVLGEKNKRLIDYISEIQTLRGILPLCSFCKKIRNDEGYWEQVDVYIQRHSQADISHSICPDCMKKYYPE